MSFLPLVYFLFFFFFNDTATTEIYTLSLHDALPISTWGVPAMNHCSRACDRPRSEEHTSELQSRRDLVCRLLLEKKKKKHEPHHHKQQPQKKKKNKTQEKTN